MDDQGWATPRRMGLVRGLALLAACVAASGCLGPKAVRHTRLRYNEVFRDTTDEQLLINIVRLRYADSPVFVDLPNITSQFEVGGEASYLGGQATSSGGSPISGLASLTSATRRP